MKLCLQCLGQDLSKQVTAQLNTAPQCGRGGEAERRERRLENNSALLEAHIGWMTKAGDLTKKLKTRGKKRTFLHSTSSSRNLPQKTLHAVR